METPIDVGGLNRAEASFLAAAVRAGDAPDLVDAVESGSARALRARLEAIALLGAEARRQCGSELEEAAHRSASTGRLPAVLLADDDRHFDALYRLEAEAFDRLARDFGAFQLAELLRDKNRREIARVAGRFESARRSVVLGALRRDRDCDRIERIRIREVFVSFSRHVDAFADRVARLGLYSVACAAGLRYRERIDEIADRLPTDIGDRLRHYHRLSYASTRRGIGRKFRRTLVRFLDCWADSRDRSRRRRRGGADE